MRFLLDQDVDIEVGQVLRRAGHECVTVWELGMATSPDDHISVYAHDNGYVVVTHDKGFSQRRKNNSYGRHMWLRCNDLDAVKVVEQHLDAIMKALASQAEVVIKVSIDGVTIFPPKWR